MSENAQSRAAGASTAAPTIAIVGSGPSGCYIAGFLRKQFATSEIVIFDRLSEPYGLVRFGVAPDHLGTKAVTRQFDRLFEREGVHFVGDTEIGVDVTLEQLRAAFDVVVLATGLWADRALDLESARIYGAGAVTRLINGHPDENVSGLDLGSRVTIVGNGNVAIDLVRLLLTPAEELRALGIADDVVAALNAGPVTRIDLVGRSMVTDAKFDASMIRELAKLADVAFHSDDLPNAVADDPGEAKREAVSSIVASSDPAASRAVHFHFGWTPHSLTDNDSSSSIVLGQVRSKARRSLESHSVVTAIGFAEHEDAAIRRHHHETSGTDLELGLLAPGLYCVGWLRRGPVGTIPANRTDSKMVADVIGAAIDSGALPIGKPGLSTMTFRR